MKSIINIAFFSFILLGYSYADCFLENQESSYQVPLRYQDTPNPLVEVLRHSYLEHTPENQFLANAFWSSSTYDRCLWPKSLWLALDNIDLNSIFTIASNYQRIADTNMWHIVKRIQNTWLGTSYGFAFLSSYNEHQLDEMFKNNKKFCRDWQIAADHYHGGQTCWREMTKDRAGIHFCYGKDEAFGVHIDYNQPTIGKIPFSDHCAYSPIALARHYKDLKSPTPDTVLNYLTNEQTTIERHLADSTARCGDTANLLQQALRGLLKKLDREQLVGIALKGTRATEAGMTLLKKVQAERTQILSAYQVDSCI